MSEEAKVAEPVAEEQGAAAEEEVKEEESNAHFEPLVSSQPVPYCWSLLADAIPRTALAAFSTSLTPLTSSCLLIINR